MIIGILSFLIFRFHFYHTAVDPENYNQRSRQLSPQYFGGESP